MPRSPVFSLAALAVVAGAAPTARAQPAALPPDPWVVTIETRPDDPIAGLWRVEGDASGRRTVEQIRFEPQPGGRYRYTRGAQLDRGALEEGEAERVGQRIFARELPARDLGGLVTAFGSDLEASLRPRRSAVYTLDQRVSGGALGSEAEGRFFYSGSTRRGRERLSRFERPAANNHVEVLVDGDEFFPLLRRTLASAERSIELQTFIYTEDSTGVSVAQVLMERARAGVEVRLLIDGLDADFSPEFEGELRAAGVEILIAHGWGEAIVGSIANVGHGLWDSLKGLFGARSAPREKRGIFNHDHRKITVVDSRVAFVGGMNIAEEYEHEWHDVHARVEGDAALSLQDLFYARWAAAGGDAERRPLPDPSLRALDYAPGRLSVDVLETLPGLKTEIKQRYLQEIAVSTDRVLIESAYFLDDAIVGGLKRKAQQGVEALVIIPNDATHDVKLVRDAFNWVQNDVVRSGVQLFKYRGPMLHSKVAAFDGLVCTVGSSNLDNLALTELAEVNVFVNDAELTEVMERRVFEVDVPASDRVAIERQSWWTKIKGGVLHALRSFL